MKILIVDDLDLNRKLLRVSLQAEGFETAEAENGRLALEVLRAGAVDCVVTDILMPEMDGYRLCQEIRSDAKLRSLPLIVYTATYVSPADKDLALSMGADVYMKKPAPAAELCAAIRSLQGRPRQKTVPPKLEVVLRQYSETLVRKLEETNHELKEEAAKLAQSEEKFLQLTASIQEVFWLTDAGMTQMVYISPAYETIWGRTCASLYASPRDWAAAIHPEDRQRAWQASLESSAKAEPYELEYRILRPDGEARWIHVRAFPVHDEKGRFYRVAGTARDISEQKRLMEQFLQAQKMEAVGRLASGVAHDFNNVLTAILGFADMALGGLPEGSAVRADIEEIKASGRRAAQLTAQLLSFSRRHVFEPKPLCLNEAVESVERMLKHMIGADIELVTRPARDLPVVFADRGQVEQMLANLCVNARDAMPEGGRIMIETCAASLAEDLSLGRVTVPRGDYALLTVSDTGAGMSEEALRHLFEPFFTTKPAGKGTGLGLATCHGIVKQSGGFLGVENQPGQGCAFRIYLPAAAGDAAQVPARAPAPKRAGRGATLLIVDDDPAVRRLASRMLQQRGYETLDAAGGEEALKLAREEKGRAIRLVISDFFMGDMDGRKLSEALQKVRPGLPILFTSGYADDMLFAGGTVDANLKFLRKPFTADSLAAKVGEVLGARSSDA